jgi:hypothetical protein
MAMVFIVYSLQYKIGSIQAPGVSFFPLLSAIGLASLSLVLLWKNARSTKTGRDSQTKQASVYESIQARKACATVVVLVLFALLHDVLGFWISVFGTMVALQRIAGVASWKWSLFGGGAVVTIGYLIFAYLMGASFPKGVIGL